MCPWLYFLPAPTSHTYQCRRGASTDPQAHQGSPNRQLDSRLKPRKADLGSLYAPSQHAEGHSLQIGPKGDAFQIHPNTGHTKTRSHARNRTCGRLVAMVSGWEHPLYIFISFHFWEPGTRCLTSPARVFDPLSFLLVCDLGLVVWSVGLASHLPFGFKKNWGFKSKTPPAHQGQGESPMRMSTMWKKKEKEKTVLLHAAGQAASKPNCPSFSLCFALTLARKPLGIDRNFQPLTIPRLCQEAIGSQLSHMLHPLVALGTGFGGDNHRKPKPVARRCLSLVFSVASK